MNFEITEHSASVSACARPTMFCIERLAELMVERASDEVWRDDHGVKSWGDFNLAIDECLQALMSSGVVAEDVVVVEAEGTLSSIARIFAAASLNCVVAPLRPERLEEFNLWKEFLRIDWIVGDSIQRVGEGRKSKRAQRVLAKLHGRGVPGLILATGGTSGTPKLVLHDLDALLRNIPVRDKTARRVLPLMHFDHIGGLDIVWRALGCGDVLISPPRSLTPMAVAQTISSQRVEIMPATPSFLNLMLLAEVQDHHDLSSLRVVPYGAEPMPSGLLARLKATLPHVSFLERFGTSETGAIPVRQRGTGLELTDLDTGFEWRIVDDELWIKSPSKALGYLTDRGEGLDETDWFRTGDVAESTSEGSFRVIGRREDMINVGGEKILPAEIESVLLMHPSVADCRVHAAPNAILGQVVAAEVVWNGPDHDALTVKKRIHEFAAGHLTRAKLPAIIRVVQSIAATRNLKKSRTVQS